MVEYKLITGQPEFVEKEVNRLLKLGTGWECLGAPILNTHIFGSITQTMVRK